jgi:hypothetical protein
MAKGKNPYNNESNLFRALTRLFSGPIVNRRTQTGRKLRRRHLDIYSNWFKSASGKQFKKSAYDPMQSITANMVSNRNRSERYVDFDQMEYMPEIASSLDIYADEMTTHSDLQQMLSIKCPNEEIKSVLDSLYHNVLNINYNLFGWSRTMCKYGDLFLYLDIDENMGIRNCIGLPPQEVERLEGEDQSNPNYVQFQWNSAGLTLENWQVAHFRVLGNDKHVPYGTSVLEPSRRIWRQLTLLEDAMMAYRIVRSPERRVFKIDVGNIAPEDVEQYMQKVMTQMKRHQVTDPTTGKIDLRYNPLSIEEDYYIPVRGTSATEISNLSGGQFTGTVEDVKYLRDKLFSALKVPQSYLTMGEGGTEDKTTLAQKDIRFARTIQRLQRVVVSELEKVGIIHLFALGYRGDDLLSFKLSLNNPSKIAELQELEHWKTKFGAAAEATEGFFSKRWIAENMLGLSEDEFLRMQREMFFDKKFMAALEAVAAGEAALGGDPAGGGGLDDLGDLGGDDTPAADEPETPEPTETPDEPEAGGDDSALLAAPPAKRDDYSWSSKGGGLKRMKSQAVPESAMQTSYRTNVKGWAGDHGHKSLAMGSSKSYLNPLAMESYVKEKRATIDLLEEKRLFTTSYEINNLLESLEKMENEIDEDEA